MEQLINLISEGEEGYVDLSNAVALEAAGSNGCLTVIVTDNSSRLQISKQLLADIGNPEMIKFLTTEANVILSASNSSSDCKLGKNGIIYNSKLAKKVAEMSGAEIKDKGSTKIGSYHLQSFNGDTVAVVSFK